MKPIYIDGDVREPIGDGNKIIIHCCNDIFVFGAGVALSIKNKWPEACIKYKEWGVKSDVKLGDVQFVMVEKDIAVGNMIAQHGIYNQGNIPPIRYEALNTALIKVHNKAKKHNASIHLPYKMCCGLAGGDWAIVEDLIMKNLCDKEIEVKIYRFEG